MKTKTISYLLLALAFAPAASCISVRKEPQPIPQYSYGKEGNGSSITLLFEKGKEHNHPLFAVWLADSAGNYLQTLYVSESIGKGVFHHVDHRSGRWMAGEIQRPASLPYWTHRRNKRNARGGLLPTPQEPVIDAYTGATPPASFRLDLRTDEPLDGKYRIYLELNQSWDWNEYWTNDKFPGDKEYMTSSQPALVYVASFDTDLPGETEMKLIGHSHPSGSDGSLNPDLTTITTASKIAKKITVVIAPPGKDL